MSTGPRPGEVRKTAYRVYWKKAIDFHGLVPAALTAENLNGAGLAAIHSVISACDALTAFHLGPRSKGQSHGEVAELLGELDLEGVREKVAQVNEVLRLKNLVEYEDREISRQEALRLVRHAERVLSWARRHLPEE